MATTWLAVSLQDAWSLSANGERGTAGSGSEPKTTVTSARNPAWATLATVPPQESVVSSQCGEIKRCRAAPPRGWGRSGAVCPWTVIISGGSIDWTIVFLRHTIARMLPEALALRISRR